MITLSQRFGVILLAIDKLGCILRWRMREKDTPTPAATISLSKFPNFQIKKDSRNPYKCKWLFHDLMKCNVTSKIWLRTQIQWSLFNWTFRWFTLIFSTMTSTNGKLFCSILFCHCDSWNDFFCGENMCITFIQLICTMFVAMWINSRIKWAYLSLNLRIKTPNNFRTDSNNTHTTLVFLTLSFSFVFHFYK